MLRRMETRVVNLDGQAQNVALRAGIGVIAVSLALAVLFQKLDAATVYRLLLVPAFFAGVYGVQAALVGTCGFTALLGRRITSSGPEPVADRAELVALRRRGLWGIATSAGVSVVTGALLVLAR
jgi:hypothetical protein